jgi:hypothetical protein
MAWRREQQQQQQRSCNVTSLNWLTVVCGVHSYANFLLVSAATYTVRAGAAFLSSSALAIAQGRARIEKSEVRGAKTRESRNFQNHSTSPHLIAIAHRIQHLSRPSPRLLRPWFVHLFLRPSLLPSCTDLTRLHGL